MMPGNQTITVEKTHEHLQAADKPTHYEYIQSPAHSMLNPSPPPKPAQCVHLISGLRVCHDYLQVAVRSPHVSVLGKSPMCCLPLRTHPQRCVCTTVTTVGICSGSQQQRYNFTEAIEAGIMECSGSCNQGRQLNNMPDIISINTNRYTFCILQNVSFKITSYLLPDSNILMILPRCFQVFVECYFFFIGKNVIFSTQKYTFYDKFSDQI